MLENEYQVQGLYDGMWKANRAKLEADEAHQQFDIYVRHEFMSQYPWRVAKLTRVVVPDTTMNHTGWVMPDYLLWDKPKDYLPAENHEFYFDLQALWNGIWSTCGHWHKATYIQTLEEALTVQKAWAKRKERGLRLVQVFVEPVPGLLHEPVLEAA